MEAIEKKKIRNKGGKSAANARRRAALKRLEEQYAAFKQAGVDKAPWDTTRNGRTIHHKGRKFDAECKRFADEIAILKERIQHA